MKKTYITTLAFLLVFFTQCSDDFLVRPPLNQMSEESFWETEEDAILAVNAIYDALQTDMGYRLGHLMFGDVPGDDMASFDGEWFVPHDNFTVDASDEEVLRSWRAWWSGIGRANAVLGRVPSIQMNEELKERLLNEAKFLRALCYLNVVNIWGDAPLITHELDPMEMLSVVRAPKEQIWAQIEKDLSEAEALPIQHASEIGRATQGAAKALLARAYLYQGKFQQAADKAKEVIDLGIYDLHDEYIKNYQTAHENGIESIFEVHFIAGTGGWGNNEGNWVPSFTGPPGNGYVPSSAWAIIVPSATHPAIYEPNDERRSVNLFEEGSVYNNIPFDPAWSPSTGALVAKYIVGDPPVITEGMVDAERNMPVLRYAEVLLILAEALNELGLTDEAEPYLNQIRERAGLEPLSGLDEEAFKDAVFQERRIELFAEGHRFFDLRRIGKLDEYVRVGQGKTNFTEPKNLYFPIPQGERDLNPGLGQNAGY